MKHQFTACLGITKPTSILTGEGGDSLISENISCSLVLSSISVWSTAINIAARSGTETHHVGTHNHFSPSATAHKHRRPDGIKKLSSLKSLNTQSRTDPHLLCTELEGPWCMAGPPSFLFMPGGGHIPDPT